MYCLISFISWFLIAQIGGGRLLTYLLPALSILAVLALTKLKNKLVQNVFIGIVIFVALVSFIYRGAANVKYIPVILGTESKSEFMAKNLNFSFGDFYDIDGYFEKNISKDDRVLVYGVHNLYYVNFKFIHESYLKPQDEFNYVLVSNGEISKKHKDFRLVYENEITRVKLYKRSKQ
jgi:hypothetical protein